jgi:hypothetical protein
MAKKLAELYLIVRSWAIIKNNKLLYPNTRKIGGLRALLNPETEYQKHLNRKILCKVQITFRFDEGKTTIFEEKNLLK